MEIYEKPVVLITGFGPFQDNEVNASWEAVKRLPKDDIERELNIELVQTELSVVYENVDRFVPELWKTYKPKLVIHVGVSNVAKHLTLEKQACRKNYERRDILGQCPPNLVCCKDGASLLKTTLNVDCICEELNNANFDGVKAETSKDAGRYLCEYIYYKSLSMDTSRVLFIHVPKLDVYSTENTILGLKKIIELCLKDLKEGAFTEGNDLDSNEEQD